MICCIRSLNRTDTRTGSLLQVICFSSPKYTGINSNNNKIRYYYLNKDMYKRHWVVLQNDYVIMQLMSRCVSIVYRRVSETKYLYRDSDTCHRDRSTVQRDIRLCHRDRLSPRPETNRNFTMAVLHCIWISTFYKIRYFDSQKVLHVSCFQRKLFHLRPFNKQC